MAKKQGAMAYKVIEKSALTDLCQTVEEWLADGWECQGGVAVVNVGDGDFMYAQAMIHRG